MPTTRRRFLERAGVLLAAAGGAAASLRFSLPVFGADGEPLDFGALEQWAGPMQELDADRLQRWLIEKLRGGAPDVVTDGRETTDLARVIRS